jgi:hypothetical protein
VLAGKHHLPADLGGHASTAAVAQAVVDQLET